MATLGELTLGGTPRVVVALSDGLTPDELASAQRLGLDVGELRIDQFPDTGENFVFEQAAVFKDVPVIATIRTRSEGGGWDGTEPDRLALFERVIPEVDAVDLELSAFEIRDAVVETAHELGKTVILSYHNFDGTDSVDRFEQIIRDATEVGADIVKMATHCSGPADVQTLAGVTLSNRDTNLITIGMGAHGALSRVFFPALGSLMTYTFLGTPTAPGQFDLEDTCRRLRAFYPNYAAGRPVDGESDN